MEAGKNTKKWAWLGVATAVTLLVLIGYSQGYRFQNNFTIGKLGILSVNLPLSETLIYVDETEKVKTTKDNERVEIKLSPRTHSIITSRIGYYPWTKQFIVPSGGNITLSPIFVSVNATGMIITDKDSEYWKIRDMLEKNQLPAKNSPLESSDKKVIIWADDNAIIAKVGSTTSTIVQPDTVIRNVAFYKDRSDAVIFSTYNAIYVIEINKEGMQNFFPIYKGTSPIFFKTDPNFIYVEDETNLMQVMI